MSDPRGDGAPINFDPRLGESPLTPTTHIHRLRRVEPHMARYSPTFGIPSTIIPQIIPHISLLGAPGRLPHSVSGSTLSNREGIMKLVNLFGWTRWSPRRYQPIQGWVRDAEHIPFRNPQSPAQLPILWGLHGLGFTGRHKSEIKSLSLGSFSSCSWF